MTGAGFPHSDIHGSKLGRQLPVTFRSHPRPSSALDAKASTVGSLYLGEQRCSCSLWNSQRAGRTQGVREECGALSQNGTEISQADECSTSEDKSYELIE